MRSIVIDTREKKPYDFPNSITRKLPTGDYSLDGLEELVCIERKSLADWVNTLKVFVSNKGNNRVADEFRRMIMMPCAYVVLETSIEEILTGNYDGGMKPQSVLGLTASITTNYCPVIFAGDRPHSYLYVEMLLKQANDRFANIAEPKCESNEDTNMKMLVRSYTNDPEVAEIIEKLRISFEPMADDVWETLNRIPHKMLNSHQKAAKHLEEGRRRGIIVQGTKPRGVQAQEVAA